MKPVSNKDIIQDIEKSDLSTFNGDYEIISIDSNFCTLDYTFIYSLLFDLKKLPKKNDYIRLLAIDERHIKASLFVNDKIVKTKIITGRLINNYFEFHTTHLFLKYIVIGYGQQTNRLALSKEEDLYLDTNRGGTAFLLILPIPLSGSSHDFYNLKFKRKNNNN